MRRCSAFSAQAILILLAFAGRAEAQSGGVHYYLDSRGSSQAQGIALASAVQPVAHGSPTTGGWLNDGPPASCIEQPSCTEECGLHDLTSGCDACPRCNLTPFFGYDSWRGVSDGTWQHNGLHAGANFGAHLGQFSELTGIGLQVGGSAGVYDWVGTDYRMSSNDQSLVQGFLTYGFFRRASENSRWSAAVVQDWMYVDNFSVFAEDPMLSQVRGQFGYLLSPATEIGVSGAWRTQSDTRDTPDFGPVTWRSVNHISAFWHYQWSPGGPDTVISLGMPESERLTGDGSLGDYVVSAAGNAPLSDRVTLYSLITYLHPSASPGTQGAKEDAWAFVLGLSYSHGGYARSHTVAGRRWMPLLPVANNGYFLVDASENY
jgi:uncharacterized protein DUF6666